MSYKPNDPYVKEFVTSSPTTGAATNADSLPSATANRNGTDDGTFALTVTNLDAGRYKITGTIPAGYAKGDVLNVSVAATVGGVAGKAIVDTRVIDSKRVGDLNDVAATAIVSGGAITTNAGSVSSVTTTTNLTTLPSIPAGWLTAAGIAANALNGKGDWLAASGYTAPPTSTVIAGAIWDLATTGHTNSGTFGAAMNAAGSAGDPWATSLPGVYGAGTAGNILGTKLDAQVSTRLAASGYTAPDNTDVVSILASVGSGLKAELDAVKAVADHLATALQSDGGSGYQFTTTALALAPTGTGGSGGASLAQIQSELDTRGLTGALTTTITTNLNATVSSRSTYSGGAVASVTGNVGGSVGSVTAPVTVGTNSDKTGYTLGSFGFIVTVGTNNDKTGYSLGATGLDAISVADPGGVSSMTTLPKMMVALWRRAFKKRDIVKTGSGTATEHLYADDGTTARATLALTDDGTTQTQGAAS